VINKFRGDETLLRPGVAMIETRLGVQCLGRGAVSSRSRLDEEDGVALEDRASSGALLEKFWNRDRRARCA